MDESHIPKLTVALGNKHSLFQAYMPFIKDGGLFLRRTHFLNPGTEVVLTIELPENEIISTEGLVVWITAVASQANKPAGMGIQFKGAHCHYLTNKIESYLEDMLQSTKLTDTF